MGVLLVGILIFLTVVFSALVALSKAMVVLGGFSGGVVVLVAFEALLLEAELLTVFTGLNLYKRISPITTLFEFVSRLNEKKDSAGLPFTIISVC